MATLKELHDFVGDAADLRAKIKSALVVKAMVIVNNVASTAPQNAFALACLGSPNAYENIALHGILGEYHTLTIAQISGASDADIQTAVNTVVDQLLGVA